jgi:hypothetical protein
MFTDFNWYFKKSKNMFEYQVLVQIKYGNLQNQVKTRFFKMCLEYKRHVLKEKTRMDFKRSIKTRNI